ncbi:Fanconi anemia group G protein isoform X1 [Callorhinchus milii]|uniref:Fanconi anemia group G protein isoform X1 n=1 Tax=Callorhinchus milii TaxID=7868 RepID=UPI001C3F7F8D|nr:Fanconi anemia group G protein isoform X1 [Callorhinchus milii]
MAGPCGGSCLGSWADENNQLVSRVKDASTISADRREILHQSYISFSKLLQKIQGLSPVTLSIPLELTVLYNTIVLNIVLSDRIDQNDNNLIYQGLLRGLEAHSRHCDKLDVVKLWSVTFQITHNRDFTHSAEQLASLQCVLWLANHQLEKIEAVFHLLRDRECAGSSASALDERSGDLLQWIKMSSVETDPGAEGVSLVIQSHTSLRQLLFTGIAFLRGFRNMEDGNFANAIDVLQQAVAGLCSKRILAQLYTLLGYSSIQMDRPQTALQYFKRALQADFQCLSALNHAAQVYHQLEMMEPELEALKYLNTALESQDQAKEDVDFIDPGVLIRPEQLLRIPETCLPLASVNQAHVKHLLAKKFLQIGRAEEAAEHYLDLLSSFLEGSQQEIALDGSPNAPRIPEVYLEAAVALLGSERHNDVITVCEEIITKMSGFLSETLTIEIPVNTEDPALNTGCRTPASRLSSDPRTLWAEKRESLNYKLWSAAALLYQGQAFALLKNNKEAITNFSRCLNLLLKVQIVNLPHSGDPGEQCESLKEIMTELNTLQKLKALAFIGKGLQLTERDQDREALQHFQLSLQASPDNLESVYHLVQLLWKLERKQEAASCWLKFHSSATRASDSGKKGYCDPLTKLPLFLISHLKEVTSSEEDDFTKKIQMYNSHWTEDQQTIQFLRPIPSSLETL